MNKKLLIRKIHRYMALLVSLQLLAWTLGGIYFSWNSIDKIHGDHLKKTNGIEATQQPLISTNDAITAINDLKQLKSIRVIRIIDKPAYRVKYSSKDSDNKTQLVNAIDGSLMPAINKQQAIKIAQTNASFVAAVAKVEYLTQTSSHHEYREKSLPAWAITFDYSSSPTFYVASEQGTLTSVRHTSWRIFDFLWMLHTMDYQTRDDFGNWLIKIFSVLALITAISGIVLFIISSRRLNKRR
jgi:hypothetical protein